MKYNPQIQRQINGQWDVGDWCVCEYHIQQVKRVATNGNVQEISDGNFSHSSLDLRGSMFPLTIWTKTATDSLSNHYTKLNGLEKSNVLNWPDIHHKFVDFHVGLCHLGIANEETYSELNEKEKAKIDRVFQDKWDEILNFCNEIRSELEGLRNKDVAGVKLFR